MVEKAKEGQPNPYYTLVNLFEKTCLPENQIKALDFSSVARSRRFDQFLEDEDFFFELLEPLEITTALKDFIVLAYEACVHNPYTNIDLNNLPPNLAFLRENGIDGNKEQKMAVERACYYVQANTDQRELESYEKYGGKYVNEFREPRFKQASMWREEFREVYKGYELVTS